MSKLLGNLTWVAYYLLLPFILRSSYQKSYTLSESQNKDSKKHPLVSAVIFNLCYILKEFGLDGIP